MVGAGLAPALVIVHRPDKDFNDGRYGCPGTPDAPGAAAGGPTGRIDVGGRLFGSVIILVSPCEITLPGSALSSSNQFDNALLFSFCSVWESTGRDGSIDRICTIR